MIVTGIILLVASFLLSFFVEEPVSLTKGQILERVRNAIMIAGATLTMWGVLRVIMQPPV